MRDTTTTLVVVSRRSRSEGAYRSNQLDAVISQIAFASDYREPSRGDDAIPSRVVGRNRDGIRVLLVTVVLDHDMQLGKPNINACDKAAASVLDDELWNRSSETLTAKYLEQRRLGRRVGGRH